ncbi:DUF1513 domain-containing protein [Pollutimonas harenae]|nr:DUF1513 domain-containing protein [Pollutimonas harenae]
MPSMEIDRRNFLALLAACGAWPGLAVSRQGEVVGDDVLYLAARKNGNHFEAAVFDERGRDQLVVPMPDRGHSFAIDSARGRAVAFGRQPGFFAIAFDLAGHHAPQALSVAAGRHFFGHGVYTPDGKLMVATENDFEAGRGVLGVYDASPGGDYRRMGEFSTAGVGPHEVVLMPDGRTLCVANGGILTHPDYGKLQLNPDDMLPSLAYIDVYTGDLLEQVFLAPDLHRSSIRHLAVDAAGAVWFGCQYMATDARRPALVGRHRRGRQPELFVGPDETLRGMKNYVGSLATDSTGTIVATSSPVGGRVVFWDASSGRCLGSSEIFDGCGVAAASQEGFVISSGQGALVMTGILGDQHMLRKPTTDLSWDNHLRRI